MFHLRFARDNVAHDHADDKRGRSEDDVQWHGDSVTQGMIVENGSDKEEQDHDGPAIEGDFARF